MTQRDPGNPQSSDDLDDEELSRALPRGSRGRRWLSLLQETRHKAALLFGASFLETTVVPIPIEVILIPYMAAERDRVWRIATLTLLGCLLGAFLGYAIGYFLFETIGLPIIGWAGWSEELETFRNLFDRHGFWAILAVGVLPIPFQVAMLAAGAASYPIAWFALAAVLARGVRYYGLAWLVKRFGPAALRRWRENKITATLAAAILLAVLWAAANWLGGLAADAALPS